MKKLFFRLSILFLIMTGGLNQAMASEFYATIRHSYCEIDWSQMTNHTVMIGDSTDTDWKGVPPSVENTSVYSSNEFIWLDAKNDDTGDGDYIYPGTNVFPEGMADIEEFRVCRDTSFLYMYVKMYAPPGIWWAGGLVLAIETGTPHSGTYDFINGDSVDPDTGFSGELRSTYPFDFFVFMHATYKSRMWDSAGNLIGDNADSTDDGSLDNYNFKDAGSWETYEVRIPFSLLGGAPGAENWKFIAAAGMEENNMLREVQPPNSDGSPVLWYPSGGDGSWWNNSGADPDVMDLIGASTLAEQESDLQGYILLSTNRSGVLENLTVWLDPRIFDPDQGYLLYTFMITEPTQVKVTVKDLNGQVVHEVRDELCSPAPGCDVNEAWWDGVLDNGDVVEPGYYILQLDFERDGMQRSIGKYFRVWRQP